VNYLIDTNIISEVRKGERCDGHVAAWFASIDDEDIFLSVLVVGEIRKGIERARRTDPAQARALEKWLSTLKQSYGERILPIDQMVADEWGRHERPTSATYGRCAPCSNGQNTSDDVRDAQRRRCRGFRR
jgi:predicted nucleic acid-binding protein